MGHRSPAGPTGHPAGAPARGRDYLLSVLVVLLSTGAAALMHTRFERANLIMVYLVGVMWVAVSLGRGPAIVASILAVASFDLFFVPPSGSFAVSDTQYLVTFAVMLLTAMVIASLAARLREELRRARVDERRAGALARLSGELLALADRERIAAAVLRHLEQEFVCRAAVLLPDPHGRLAVAAGDPALLGPAGQGLGVAQWSFDAGQPAGLGTDTLADDRCLHVPIRGASRELGVITIAPADIDRLMASDTFHLLETFINHTALALERAQLGEQAERARLESAAERLRSGLLSSVSHDLRTPLAVITGAATTLLEAGDSLPESERSDMLRSVADEASRLNRLVGNLLAMTRLESGTLEVKRSWHPLEEVIGSALHRIEVQMKQCPVVVHMAPHLPLVAIDDVLIEQVVFNLVENAMRHASSPQPIEIRARTTVDEVEVSVADRGPGLPEGAEEAVFEAFHRGRATGRTSDRAGNRVGDRAGDRSGGAGLGLAVCRGIVLAHGGRIRAGARVGGGAEFVFTLPLDPDPPRVEPEDSAIGEEPHKQAMP